MITLAEFLVICVLIFASAFAGYYYGFGLAKQVYQKKKRKGEPEK